LRDAGEESDKLKQKMQALAKRLPGSSLDNFKVLGLLPIVNCPDCAQYFKECQQGAIF
jgi:hypothetical protein